MRDHLFRRRGGEKAQIVTAGGFMVRREPLGLVGVAWPHIDFLVAENQRRPGRVAVAGIEQPDLHAEYLPIPLGGTRDIGDIDHQMIERVDLDRHGLSLRRGVDAGVAHGRRRGLLVTTRAAVNSTTTNPGWRTNETWNGQESSENGALLVRANNIGPCVNRSGPSMPRTPVGRANDLSEWRTLMFRRDVLGFPT